MNKNTKIIIGVGAAAALLFFFRKQLFGGGATVKETVKETVTDTPKETVKDSVTDSVTESGFAEPGFMARKRAKLLDQVIKNTTKQNAVVFAEQKPKEDTAVFFSAPNVALTR
jgi:hypothetical protein